MEPLLARTRRFLGTPYGVMSVVIVMYLAKVAVKVGIGASMHSPMLEGDGWHNASDIFQAAVVIVGVYLSRRPPSKDYPFGWVALDALLTLAIAAALFVAAFANVLVPSLAGIAYAFAPGIVAAGFVPSRLDAGPDAVLAVGVMLASAAVSVLVSRYQVRVGTATGHASVVADGEETMGDGKIEALAAAGLFLQVVTGLGWLEYLFGLAMAYVMAKTAREIFENGWGMLANRSLGNAVENAIAQSARSAPGVREVRSLVTYRRGTCQVAELAVETLLTGPARRHLEGHLAACVRAVLAESAGGEAETAVTVRAGNPAVEETRWGYLVRFVDGKMRVIVNPAEATHLVVCEVTNGVIMSCRDLPVAPEALAATVAEKRIAVLCVRVGGEACFQGQPVPGVRIESVPTSDPRLLGIPAE